MKREISKLKDIHSRLSSPATRRSMLISRMDSLKDSQINCYACTGLCCTFESNSMQVTPQEALDVLLLLDSQNRINPELIEKLESTVQRFRLDKEISTGRGSSFRRYYTCTFYEEGAKGCSLTRTDKPYGCLAYNAKMPGATAQDKCGSDIALLQTQDTQNSDDLMAEQLRAELGLSWTKLPLPMALLDLMK